MMVTRVGDFVISLFGNMIDGDEKSKSFSQEIISKPLSDWHRCETVMVARVGDNNSRV